MRTPLTGPAAISTLPLVSRQAGASLQPTVWPFASSGKSGPIVQVPGSLANAGGVYSALCPLAPAKNARPSLSSTPAPICWRRPR